MRHRNGQKSDETEKPVEFARLVVESARLVVECTRS